MLTAESFAADVARLSANQPLALAVSGGADSLALMWLAAPLPVRPYVLSVDHGLRAGAAEECRMVGERAAELGLSHIILTVKVEPGASVQALARRARYRAMAEWCHAQGVGVLATAHHQDDQAETLLMRLARGAGLSGLSGIREVSTIEGLRVIRPLLAYPKAELEDVLKSAGWGWVTDPSNDDPRHDRTHARRLLASAPWLSAERLGASAAHLAQAEEALEWAATRAWETRACATDDGWLLDPLALPPELQRRLLIRALAEMGECNPDGPTVSRLTERLSDGGGGTIGRIVVRARLGRWDMRPAPARRSEG